MSPGEIVFAFLRPSSATLILLLAGLVLLPLRRRLGTLFLALGAAGFAVFGLLPVGAAALVPLETRFPTPRLAAPPDGIVVLGGYLDGGRANDGSYLALSEAGERLTAAAELALRFPESRLVIAGNPIGPQDQSSAELSASLLETFGIARARMVLEDRSTSTAGNARHALERASPRPDERYLLVTSAFHMPRAMATFRGAGWPAMIAYPVDHRVPTDGELSLQDPLAGLALADLAAREWVALVVYRILGRTDALLPSPGAPAAAGDGAS